LPDARVRTPKPVADRRDVRSAPLSPTDGFVLSRVDGLATEKDILATTGLPEDQVLGALAKLETLGLITFDSARPATPASSGTVAAAGAHATSSNRLRAAAPSPEPTLTPEEEAVLGEEVDLDVDIRRRVLVMYRGLAHLDHYALLGVAQSDDRKALKRAYFDLAAKFHPDKYFRKNLGTYKVRMEAIFGRITQAHDTLTSKEGRAEYDAYLDEQRRLRPRRPRPPFPTRARRRARRPACAAWIPRSGGRPWPGACSRGAVRPRPLRRARPPTPARRRRRRCPPSRTRWRRFAAGTRTASRWRRAPRRASTSPTPRPR
jgi:hypothetical protein